MNRQVDSVELVSELRELLPQITPGPWLVGTGGGGGATTFVYEMGEDGKQKSAIAGCTLNYVERLMEERIANAKLIALAPQMADLIESLSSRIRELEEQIGNTQHPQAARRS